MVALSDYCRVMRAKKVHVPVNDEPSADALNCIRKAVMISVVMRTVVNQLIIQYGL